jgi:hypothetical protein
MSNPYTSPEGDSMATGDTTRSGCLVAWLVLMAIANGMSALANFGFAAAGGAAGVSGAAFAVLGLLSLVNLGAAGAIWMRMKVGFYMVLGSVAIGMLINLAIGQYAGLLGGLIGPAILWWLISDEWSTYR